MSRFFFYGTLKTGYSANDLLRGAPSLGAITTHARYHLYRIAGFPGMVVGEATGGVRGELFEVEDECIEDLDQYEGVPHLFRREQIDLADGTKAWAYLYNRPIGDRKEIKNGEWK